jgi:hypothetical protein
VYVAKIPSSFTTSNVKFIDGINITNYTVWSKFSDRDCYGVFCMWIPNFALILAVLNFYTYAGIKDIWNSLPCSDEKYVNFNLIFPWT